MSKAQELINRLEIAHEQLQRQLDNAYDRIDLLEELLNEALDYFDDRADVVDGEDGRPEPNREMTLASIISEALEGPRFK